MKYLLDTHVLLWLEFSPEKLPQPILDLLANPKTQVYFSLVNFWEIAIKSGLKKQDFHVNIKQLYQAALENDFIPTNLKFEYFYLVETLPSIHKDPFDRLLIAQAMQEHLCLITHDEKIWQYPNLELLKV